MTSGIDNKEGKPLAPERENPFQEEEEPRNEETRRAPGVEREYQGGASDERRAPGEEEDDDQTADIDRKIARSSSVDLRKELLMTRLLRHFTLALAMAIALGCVTLTTTTAVAKGNPEITRQELVNFNRFLDANPKIRYDLTRNPSLVNDPRYMQEHPELRDFLGSHAGVREELHQTPNIFMRREYGYTGAGGGGYYRDEDQPHMEAAMQHLRQAIDELSRATSDKGGHRVRALDLARQAEAEVNAGVHFDDRH